jgi:small-conductance mechanosensitive channel
MRFLFAWLALLAACGALPGAALGAVLPIGTDTAPAPAADTPPPGAIAQAQEAGDDDRIADRIAGIFAQLPAFSKVEVSVSEGVVTLSGIVPDAAAIARAEAIAGRVSGVVTVTNALERDLSVESGLSVFGQMSSLVKDGINALPLFAVAVLTALVIATLGYLLAGLAFIWNRIAPNIFLAELIRGAIRVVFTIAGLVIALDMLGAGALLGAVLGGAGVVGIALGFAMRETIENYVASVMLSLRQPFRPNDHVVIDSLEGRVIRLTSRATILMTLEGNHLRIPNAQVFKAVILNYTRNPQRRLDFALGVDADDDPRAAMTLGTATLRSLPFVLAEPEPAARITDVGDSNIVILFLGWIDQREADWFKSRSLAIAAVKDALEEAGFALPEPIYRLRFDGRGDPLPIERNADATGGKGTRPKRASGPAQHADVRPEGEITALVEAERASDPAQMKDLLDPRRPEE